MTTASRRSSSSSGTITKSSDDRDVPDPSLTGYCKVMTAGVIVDKQPWPSSLLTVHLETGELVTAHLAGAFRLRMPRLRIGDRVHTEPSIGERVRILGRAPPIGGRR